MTHDTKIRRNFGITYDPQAVCSCGWVGPQRKFEFPAVRDAKKHWKAVAGYDAS